MRTTYTALSFSRHKLHLIGFDIDSFHEHDLLWLPHHAQLLPAGRKRQAEHLAGRLAAFHALTEYGHKTVPAIGDKRQPLWPEGLFGSISHSAATALAVVSLTPVGVDIEAIFTPQTAAELTSSIVDNDEQRVLQRSSLPFPLALTLAFSAKESVYKAFSDRAATLPGFASARIVSVTKTHLTMQMTSAFSSQLADCTVDISWREYDGQVITLCASAL
ncbi:enterobactin synthase subunit EntD [Citrobacter koseri]|uniref:enterobactin synthase subunit EntD n=1 Tax=Citrobacter koseri TaxID=545 RepID=UPI0029439E8C|nr:enterobactin synthase subunit EntD [Citrobacter koseri]WOI97351.1 enterobactin synthase subunit EntD [Citrobacter koseri]